MNQKYEFTGETKNHFGHTLHRIKALASFGDVKKGDIGGWIEAEKNLSESGNARVSGNAWVSGKARVSSNARVFGEYDFITMGPIGSRSDITTFYRLKQGGIGVNCGCFNGTLDDFEEAVHKTHTGTIHERAYMATIRMAKEIMIHD